MANQTQNLEEYTVPELKAMADEKGIDVPSHATKDEIIKALEKEAKGGAKAAKGGFDRHSEAELRALADQNAVQYPAAPTKEDFIKALEEAGVNPLALPAGAINPLPLSGIVADTYGEGKVYKIAATDIAGLGASTTGNLLLDTYPAGAIIQYVRVKNTVQGAGVTTCPVQVNDGTNTYGSAFDICTAVSATNLVTVQSTSANVLSFAAPSPIYLAFTGSTGGNLGALTAGAVSVWIRYVLIA